MRFYTLELKGIRHFLHKKIDFTEGLNIVYGPNESGKSTVLDSLLASLLKPTSQEMSSLKQWNAISSEIKLVYQTNSGTFTVTRSLDPVGDVLEGEDIFLEDDEEIEIIIENHVGIADHTIFENSTTVRQNEMQILQEEGARAKVRNQVKTLLSGVPERSTDEALRFLEDEISGAESFLEGVDERIKTIESVLHQYKKIDEEYQDMKTRLDVYESDLARDRALRAGYDVLLSYREKENQYEILVENVEKVENLRAYIRKLPIREKELVQDLQEDLDKISVQQDKLIIKKGETRRELAALKEKLTIIDDELEDVHVEKESIFSKLASLFRSSRSKKEELAGKRVEVSQNVARLEDLLEQYEEKIEEWRTKFQQKGERLKQLMEECREYENWTADMMEDRRKEYEAEIEKILQGMSERDLEQKIKDIRKEADELRAKLVREYPDLKERKDTERISIEKEKLDEIITEWEEKIAGIEAQLELISEKVSRRESLTKELKQLKKEREERETQKKADEIAHSMITSVYQELKDKFAPELEKRAEILFKRITHGRYHDIVVRKEDLDVLVRVPEKAEPVHVGVLSQGTRDQLYLCLRIALSELLTGDKNPPLLFDEAFYTFDQDRLQETLTVLQEIAETTQIIVFTHDEAYAQYGNPILLERTR